MGKSQKEPCSGLGRTTVFRLVVELEPDRDMQKEGLQDAPGFVKTQK